MSLLLDLPANVRAGAAKRGRPSVGDVLLTLGTARYWSVFLFRLSQRVKPLGPLAAVIKQLNQVVTGADIAPTARIGAGLVLYHPNGVVIGREVAMGMRCVVQQGVTIGGLGGVRSDGGQETVIGDRVFLGAGARVIGAVTVGDGAIVGANAVVTKSVPPGAIATGVPASWRAR